jgi:RNA polymerase sigma-70 factor (ECF subfamily)
MMKHFSDAELVEEIRAGSQVAFSVLMKRYEKMVYRTGYYYVRQPEQAMDITQNVFLKIYEKLTLFKGTGSFKAWLMRITHNECTDWLRKNRPYKQDVELTPVNTPILQPVQEKEVARREYRELLMSELQKLNDKQRMVVALRYFEDMPIREIAGVLECTDGMVKSILFRSLEKLRNRLTLKRRDDHEGMSRFPEDNSGLHRG